MLLPSATPPDGAPGLAAEVVPAAVGSGVAGLVNKKELAAIIGCSLPTLASWLDRYPDFPVDERGTNGREWRFCAATVVTYLRDKRDQEEREASERAARLQQFALPGLDQPDDLGLSKPADLLAMARVRQIQRREQMEAGLLVPTSDVRAALSVAFAKLNRFQNSILSTLARKHGWGDAQTRDAQALMRDAQRAFVRDLGRFDPAGGGADQPVDLFSDAPEPNPGTIAT